MLIEVYTKSNCPYCVSAKNWLKQKGYEFSEINLDDSDVLAAFKESYPNLRTVPQIIVDNTVIGGFTDLIKSELA